MFDYMALVLFAVICIVLMFGYPVALSLAGTALAFAGLGLGLDALGIDANFDPAFLSA
ncbi:C4-dicarboxylate ABC transporter, partial [Halomonas sp. BBD45]|nr:C4-dicarboxylate ABC transporter [Halomonas sp. BBD45]